MVPSRSSRSALSLRGKACSLAVVPDAKDRQYVSRQTLCALHKAGRLPAILGQPQRLARILALGGRSAAVGRPGRVQEPLLAPAPVPVPSSARGPALIRAPVRVRVQVPVRALGVVQRGLAPEHLMAVEDFLPSPVLHQ